MRTQSPWSTMASAVVILGFALYFFHTAYAPPDSTPLHGVEGAIANVGTTWIHHSSKSGGWNAPVVTIVVADGESIRLTAHSKNESQAVLALAGLSQGSIAQGQVDANGEIWQLSAGGNEPVKLADTLARHHQLVQTRNLACAIMLILGVGMGVFGFKRIQAANSLDL
jgi:hypothetical protein